MRKNSLFLIYALVDPDTKKVRYIGRSRSGLSRPRNHVTRVNREFTHKANWIRSLLSQGKIYLIRVLERCDSAAETVGAEIRWIAYGRGQGWPLTNLTDGGEGASRKKKDIPLVELGRLYVEGESELSLARRYQVNRWTIRKRLWELGIDRRGRSESMKIRMSNTTPDDRWALSEPARIARRRRAKERRNQRTSTVDAGVDAGAAY